MATVPVAFMCYFFPNVNYLFFFSTFVYPSGEAGGVFFYNNDLSFFGPIPSIFCLLHIGQCKSPYLMFAFQFSCPSLCTDGYIKSA